jgi:hypothetical protein
VHVVCSAIVSQIRLALTVSVENIKAGAMTSDAPKTVPKGTHITYLGTMAEATLYMHAEIATSALHIT